MLQRAHDALPAFWLPYFLIVFSRLQVRPNLNAPGQSARRGLPVFHVVRGIPTAGGEDVRGHPSYAVLGATEVALRLFPQTSRPPNKHRLMNSATFDEWKGTAEGGVAPSNPATPIEKLLWLPN